MSGSPQFLIKYLRFAVWWRWTALVVGFPAMVNAVRFALAAQRMADDSNVISPHRLLAARVIPAVLLLVVGLCLYVWFGRRRLEIAFDEAPGELVIRLRGLLRTGLRRIGLAGFSLVRTDLRRRWLWFRANQIVIEFIDGHIEPVVDVPFLDDNAFADELEVSHALFTLACRVRQAPSHVLLHAAIDREDGEDPTLAFELVVDGKKLPEVDFGALDLAQLEQSLVADGTFFIWTCRCGDPGCGGNFSGVQVEHEGDLVHWSDHDMCRRYTFRLSELRSAFERAASEARELCRQGGNKADGNQFGPS